MSKNTKDQEKRRQRKLAKQKTHRKARQGARPTEQARKVLLRSKLQRAMALTRGGTQIPPLSDDDLIFWLCHGANYLASDSTTGVWAPLFEGIYQGRLPAPEAVAQKVIATYREALEAEGPLDGVPRVVFAWTQMDKNVVTVYKHEAVRRLKEKDPDCDAEELARAPHNPTVWALMDQVKQRSSDAGETTPVEGTA